MNPCSRRLVLRTLTLAAAALAARAAPAGIPPRSLPRLIRLQDELADVDPRQLALAVECDARIPPPRGLPRLLLSIHAAVPGRFAPIDLQLKLVPQPAPPAVSTLPAAASDRQRLYFGLAGDGRALLASAQNRLRELQGQHDGRNRTHVTLSIDQQPLLPSASGFERTRWDAWLQSARQDGYYPIWSGTVRELAEESHADG